MIAYSLIVPAFVAGVLTFLAPCTLPLVPGYLGFISGVSLDDLRNSKRSLGLRRKIFFNGLLYVVGFSLVFVVLGSLVGFAGSLVHEYQVWLSRLGGVLVVFFGLYMMRVFSLPGFMNETRFLPARYIKPGKPVSSFLFGASFAFGWTPCVGPVLGSILTLAATSATLAQGAFLLAIFSLGLAIPFLFIAGSVSWVAPRLPLFDKYLHVVSVIGGMFLVVMGLLLITDSFGAWNNLL